MTGLSGTTRETATSRSFASGRRLSRTWPSKGARSTGSSGAICERSSSRESDRRSSTRRLMRVTCSCIMPKNFSCAFKSLRAGPWRVSMKPRSDASGVRSSWLALATKSERMRSMRRACEISRKVIRKMRGVRPSPPISAGATRTT
ncbi:hypothetical protein D9M72_477640 [compost metagenome]